MFVLPKITASQGTCTKISPIHTLIQQILGSHELVSHSFLTTPTQKYVKQFLDFLNLNHHANSSFYNFILKI